MSHKLLSNFLSTKLFHIAPGMVWIAVGLGILDQISFKRCAASVLKERVLGIAINAAHMRVNVDV